MSEHVVKKAFNIVNRRLKLDDTVTAADDLYPFKLGERVANGFLELKKDEVAADAAPVAETPPPSRPRGGAKAPDPTE